MTSYTSQSKTIKGVEARYKWLKPFITTEDFDQYNDWCGSEKPLTWKTLFQKKRYDSDISYPFTLEEFYVNELTNLMFLHNQRMSTKVFFQDFQVKHIEHVGYLEGTLKVEEELP
jgi:hypothetical protein